MSSPMAASTKVVARRGWRRLLIASSAGIAIATTGLASPSPAVAAVAPALSTVKLNPTDLVGGGTSTGTVTLTATAPIGGVAVALTSDDPAAATVPASVTVPAGATAATFTVLTSVVPNTQPSLIIGTAGGVTTYGIITVWTAFAFTHGSISILPGGTGNGTVTSQPAGINCTLSNGNGSGACGAFFTTGTVVKLTAKAGAGSSFQGIRGVGCADPSKITIARSNVTCQVGFATK